MRKIKAWCGLQVVCLGIRIFESVPFGMLSPKDKEDLQRLWDYHDEFKKVLA